MNQADAISLAKDATAHVPHGARERVWRRLSQPPRPASVPVFAKVLAFGVCTAAGFLIVSALTSPSAPTVFSTDGSVALGTAAREADGTLSLASGRLMVSSWAAPAVQIVALQHRIEAEAALFRIDVAGESVTLDVREGEVRINGERVEAGHRWPAGVPRLQYDYSPVVRLEPARAGEDRAWTLAEKALQAGDYPRALARFDALGGGGLRAEAALLRKGELQLRQLSTPADALKTFDEALRRFPSGSLTQELALSSLEAALALGRWAEARTRANDFLGRFPQSERLLDVRYVSALAAWQLDDKSTTCEEIRGLQTAAFAGERRATLEKLAAQCTLFER